MVFCVFYSSNNLLLPKPPIWIAPAPHARAPAAPAPPATPTPPPPGRGVDGFQQLALGGAVLDGAAHVGDHAFVAPAEGQDADDDHLAVLDRQLLALADRERADRAARRRVVRVLARQPLGPRIAVDARALRCRLLRAAVLLH